MKRVLVIRLSAMGDVAMTLPVIKQALTTYPELHIDLLTRQSFSAIFPQHDRLRLLFPDLAGKHKGFFGLWRLYRSLNKNNYSAIVDLHNVLRSRILSMFFRLSSARIARLNKGRIEKGKLIRKKKKVLHQLKTTHERYADVFRRLALAIRLPNANSIAQNIQALNRIGIAPFAAHREKMWSIENSEKLIEELLKIFSGEIYLFGGGPHEELEMQRLAKSSDRVIATVGLPLNEQLQIMSTLKVLVSMDSANMHLASNVGVPVISLWGATHPYAGFLGFGQTANNCIQRNDLDCRPCSVFGNKTCWRGDWACMDISAQNVVKKVTAFIE